MHRTLMFSRRDVLKATGVAAALSVLPITAGIVNAADTEKMKIGIIGSGHVGSALGGVWAKAGNEVMFSSRNLDNDKKLAAEVGANARAGTPQEAAAFGQVILFAVPYSAFRARRRGRTLRRAPAARRTRRSRIQRRRRSTHGQRTRKSRQDRHADRRRQEGH